MLKKIILVLFFVPLLSPAQNISHLTLNDINGESFSINENLDHDATVILFWATWCKPCKLEFPKVQKVLDRNEDIDIQVLTISQDSPRSLVKVKAFARSHKYDFTYLIDPDKEVGESLLVSVVPHSFLVNKKGEIVYSHVGYREGDEEVLEKEILKLLKTKE
ncbi:MAG: TlpA family protein disulfide reductase [Calditrichaeota bacterium]|nr:MAG: TlpA family protein disulfide reductase [Calditrichota bacterium]MBL1206499.1 TlpA family protein disulfide reductase [Calditrichota bacterium]NOG46326.1 TlpA family protein disulfide reductase [Calditrichota bacterium]